MEDSILNNNLAAEKPNEQITSIVSSGYYRSKIFTATKGINHLVEAAAPLFAIASRLKLICPPKNSDKFHSCLTHEIKAFENKAQVLGFRSNIILAARYALCCLLDELILKTAWGKNIKWEQDILLQTFHHETDDGERFFAILNRALEDSGIHLDLLELMYLCLSMGYEGKYQFNEADNHELTFVINNLYNVIGQHRGDISKSFSVTTKVTNDLIKSKVEKPISWWLLIAIIILINSLIFAALDWHLTIVSQPLQNVYELAK